MAGEWEEAVLADVSSDVSYGYTESATDEKVGPRFLRITDIQNGVVNWANVPYCPISADNHQKYLLQEGDIVVARTGNSTGENFLYQGGEDAVFASYLIRFRIDCQKADPRFVWYNLRSRNWWNFINNSKTGSAQAGANAKILGLFPLNLPPFTEQRAIAHILGTLDDKIELNRRMNETLEAMARALFKSWFVDFDPVRAKAERRDPGLPKPLADLFPDSFEDSELGEIPKGWGTHPLGELLSLDKGLSYKGQYLTEHGVPMVNLGCFLGHGRFTEKAIKKYSGEYKSRHVVRPRDLVLANTDITQQRDVIGSPALVPPQGDLSELIFSHHVFAVRFHEGAEFWKTFVYFLLLQDDFRARAAGFATGTTVLALPRDAVLNLRCPGAPRALVAAFAEIALPILERGWNRAEESRTLIVLRDTLLPKLISGEVRVREAERLAKAVV